MQAFPSPQSTNTLVTNFQNQQKILKNQLNLHLITYEQYYDQLLQLELAHEEEIAKIEAENRQAKYSFFAENVSNISQIFSDNAKSLIAEVDGDLSKLEDKSQVTSALLIAGIGSTMSNIFSELEEGELTVGSFFKSLLKGALAVLPALATIKGLMEPWTLIAVTAGVTGLVAFINSMTKKQQSGFHEGGLIKGKYSGKDKVHIMAEEGEFIVPRDITKKHLPSLERLRYTGQWNAPNNNNNNIIANKIDNLISVIKNTERQVKHTGQVSVNNKYFDDVKWNNLRMAY